MSHTKNPAPGHSTGNGDCQAAKLDGVNLTQSHTRAQALVTVDRHQAFRDSIAPAPEFDDLDADLDLISGPSSRRSEREISRLLGILDNLPPARGEMERMARRG